MIVKMEPDEFYTFRVQYLADADPFNCLTMFPMPTRAPTYAFASSVPLATQLGAVVRLLGAPQRVHTPISLVTDTLAVNPMFRALVLTQPNIYRPTRRTAGRCRAAGVQGRRLRFVLGPRVVARRADGRGGRPVLGQPQKFAGGAHAAQRPRTRHYRLVCDFLRIISA